MSVSNSVNPAIQIYTSFTSYCAGDTAHFSSVINGGGPSPQYQWFKNGTPVNGATSTTLQLAGFSTGDVVSCRLISSAACALTDTVYSNTITLTVNPNVLSTLTIVPHVPLPVCETQAVTFTASHSTPGTTLSYAWYVDGVITQGGDDSVFTVQSPHNGDTVICYAVSLQQCPVLYTATSNMVVINTVPVLVPSVTITANQPDTVCAGTAIVFTATAVNGGNQPVYTWLLNGNNVGGGTTYSTTQLVNGDTLVCEMISDAGCVTQNPVASNSIVAVVQTAVQPSVTIVSDHGTKACADETVTFTATSINGGATPAYQWSVNNQPTGSSSIFSSGALANGDVVKCVLTSSLNCVNSQTAQSNTIQMQIGGSVIPDVQLNGCELAAQYIPNESYQWYANSSLLQGAVTRFYTAAQTAYYYVVVTDADLCRAQSADVYVNYPACISTGVDNLSAGLDFAVYEVQQNQWKVTANTTHLCEMDVYNAQGQLLYKAIVENGMHIVDTESFAVGVYLVRLKTADLQYLVKKIMKQ